MKLYSDMHKTGKVYLEHVIEFTGLQDDIHRKFKNYSLSASGEWMSFLVTTIVYIIILVAADILIFNKKGEVS